MKYTEARDILEHQDILAALETMKARGIETYRKSTGFDLKFNNDRYPPKEVIQEAVRIKEKAKEERPVEDLWGGRPANSLLMKLGFKIYMKDSDIEYHPGMKAWTIEIQDKTYDEITEELSSTIEYTEGQEKKLVIKVYERNRKARTECIKHYGDKYNCEICGFNFKEAYGSAGKEYIHVHHIVPLSKIREEYVLDPTKDLIPVCPNCHAMIHKNSKEPVDVNELKRIIQHNKTKASS